MSKIISITNVKGGTAKTTTAASLASILADDCGKRVLVVDMNPYGSLSSLAPKDDSSVSLADYLAGGVNGELAVHLRCNLDIVRSGIGLKELEHFTGNMVGVAFKWSKLAGSFRKDYDVVIIDTPPVMERLTEMSLSVSDAVLIPVVPDAFSLSGLGYTLALVDSIRKDNNSSLDTFGILRCRFRPNGMLEGMISKLFEKKYGELLLASRIRECSDVPQAVLHKTDVCTYAPNCNAALDYRKAAEEILTKI